MMDFGASLLAWTDSRNLAKVLRTKPTGFGSDVCVPFAKTHMRQVEKVQKAMVKTGVNFKFPRNSLELVDEVVRRSEDIFELLPGPRAEAVKHYIELRKKYLKMFM